MWFAKLFGRREDDSEPAEHSPHPVAVAPKAVPVAPSRAGKTGHAPKAAAPKNGFDPYNSGNFDKNRAWERVLR